MCHLCSRRCCFMFLLLHMWPRNKFNSCTLLYLLVCFLAFSLIFVNSEFVLIKVSITIKCSCFCNYYRILISILYSECLQNVPLKFPECLFIFFSVCFNMAIYCKAFSIIIMSVFSKWCSSHCQTNVIRASIISSIWNKLVSCTGKSKYAITIFRNVQFIFVKVWQLVIFSRKDGRNHRWIKEEFLHKLHVNPTINVQLAVSVN